MKNLNYVGSLVQLDLQDYTTHGLTRIMQFAIDCVKNELRYKTDRSIEVAYLTLNDVLNAPWPANYEYYTKVAINLGGQMVTLTLNNDIPLVRRADCGEPVIEQPDLSLFNPENFDFAYGYAFAPHYRNGMYVGEAYGMGGGFNQLGYFREDHQMRQFQFYNVPRTEIMLEYVADKSTSGGTLVPYMDVPVIRAYVKWQIAENDAKVSLSDKMRKHGLFLAAMANRVDIEFAPTMSDYLDSTYESYQSSPKR